MTLERLRLIDPVGVEFIEARVLDIVDLPLIGAVTGRPSEVTGSRWTGGVPLAGAPLGPGEDTNLVLWLRRDGSEWAGFQRIEVDDAAGGRSYRWRSIVEFTAVEDCAVVGPNA